MPSFNTYIKQFRNTYNGVVRAKESEMIMEATWYEDLATKTCYFYDWYHDDYKTQLDDLHPESDSNKIPMDIKFIVNGSQRFGSDQMTYHLQMKTSQECIVPYYEKVFRTQYGSYYPCGLYVDIPDSKGVFNRWLVVGGANFNDPQFPTFELLRCDKIIQYIFNNKKYNVAGVMRNRNSYNSGLETSGLLSTTEDQIRFILPLNRDTENVGYNMRFIIDANVLTEPRAWYVSKMNRLTAKGLCTYTLVQDAFDYNRDYVEFDDLGNPIGYWADYYSSPVSPTEESVDAKIHGEFTYSTKPQLKLRGGYKKLTLTFYDDDSIIDIPEGRYSYEIEGNDATDLLDIIIDENTLKIKLLADDSYLGKVLTVKYITQTGASAEVQLEIIGM